MKSIARPSPLLAENSTQKDPQHRSGNRKSRISLAYLLALIAPLLIASVSASVTDDRITASAQDSYVFKTYLSGDSVDIKSQDGVVTLTGIVSDAPKMKLAEQTVEGLPGVIKVNNGLTVQPKGPAEQADDLIAGKVNFLLLVHPSVSAKATKVSVQNGIVILSGEASSLAQKELTTEYAEDVDGVERVQNEMTLAGKTDDFPETLGGKIDDASISAQIKTSLMWHRSTSAIHTNVTTKDAVVTISGIAKNNAEKALVSKIAGDVRGVSAVRNDMTVEGRDGVGLR